MKKQNQKIISTISLLAVLFMTFGITFLDFDNLSIENNVRPYLMLVLGLVSILYFLYVRKKYKD
ncbi:MAG TPA: hypothetical protein VIN10_13810 [Bacteroidales bacterium]